MCIQIFHFQIDLHVLEKCRLSLNFDEALVLDNSALLSLFRQYLDHRNSLPLYHIYMALLGHTDIEDELLRQNLLRIISIHRINFSDQLITKINTLGEHTNIGDLKEVGDKIYITLQEYVIPLPLYINCIKMFVYLYIYKVLSFVNSDQLLFSC